MKIVINFITSFYMNTAVLASIVSSQLVAVYVVPSQDITKANFSANYEVDLNQLTTRLMS